MSVRRPAGVLDPANGGGAGAGTRSNPARTKRFELLAKRADQGLPFPFVVRVIRHRRDLDEKECLARPGHGRHALPGKVRGTSWLKNAAGRLGCGIEIVSDPLPPGRDIVTKILAGHFLQGREDLDVAIRERHHARFRRFDGQTPTEPSPSDGP